MGYAFRKPDERSKDARGFFQTSLNRAREVVSLLEAVKKVPSQYGGNVNGAPAWRTFIPCYKSMDDPATLRYVVIVRWNVDKTVEDPDKLADADRMHPSIPIPQTGPLHAV